MAELVGRSPGPIRLVVLQPTPYCNIDCSYCYLGARNDRSRMSDDVLDAVGRNVLASRLAAPEIGVVWHAGEPTVLPPEWYESAFARLAAAAHGPKLQHSFQTNGIAIDDRWIDLWRRWHVRVGVSIDGPRALNDLHRKTRRGAGTFELAVRGLRRLRDAGFPFHVITVLSRESLDRADALMDFYRDEGIAYVCFNVEEEEGGHRHSSLAVEDIGARYVRFLRRCIERMRRDPGMPSCREVDGVVALAAASAEERGHNPQVVPLEIVSVAVTGDMSTFSPEFLGVESSAFDNFAFGNVLTTPVEAVLANPAFRRLAEQIEDGVAACRRQCAYFGVCGGGAPANKFFEHGTCATTETLYCRLTCQAVIEAVLPELEAEHG